MIVSGYIESITFQPSFEITAICKSEETTSEEFGTLVWPPSIKSGVVYATCKHCKVVEIVIKL